MPGGSSGTSEQVVRILAQLMIHGPSRVEKLQKRCSNMSKRTFYLALKEAEESGLLVRVRKSRKNVLVQLNARNDEIGRQIEAYDHQRKLLGLYYTPDFENTLQESLQAASKSRNRKELTQLILNQAWLYAITSVMSILTEANVDNPISKVQLEVENFLLQKHRQMVSDCIKEYDAARAALEAWATKQAKEAISKSISN